MELAKIRSLSDEELLHQEKTSGEQLFRLRFQVSMGQNDGVKKLRQLRKEIAQLTTVARERALGVRGAAKEGAVATTGKGAREMATQETAQAPAAATRRNEKGGNVVSTKMQKTIVV